MFVLYSYSGWNAATYIVGELHDPTRNLPRALFVGTAIVIALYVSLNAVFLVTTPMHELAGQLDVAIVAGKYIFGEIGGRIVGALICLGLVSSISAMTWIGPRVTMTMGEDMSLLRVFARKSKQDVPAIAIIFSSGCQPAAVDPELRSGAGLHPVQPHLLFVFRRAGRHQDANHSPRSWRGPIAPGATR